MNLNELVEKKIKFLIDNFSDESFNVYPKVETYLRESYADIVKKTLERVKVEEGIKWMQEGNNKNRKGYTEGFNSALQEIQKKGRVYRRRIKCIAE